MYETGRPLTDQERAEYKEEFNKASKAYLNLSIRRQSAKMQDAALPEVSRTRAGEIAELAKAAIRERHLESRHQKKTWG